MADKLIDIAIRVRDSKIVFESNKIHDTKLKPIGVGLNNKGEVGVLFDSNQYPFTSIIQDGNTTIITDTKIQPCEIVVKDTTDLVESVLFENVFNGPFESIEEFDKMFMNEDSVFVF